jgi:tetratricopeptide (TPR) repeat protein/KaiC/GvpD/RAD55 family RecA-like ATPase
VPSHEPEVVPSPRPLTAKETQLIDRVDEMKFLKEAVDRTLRGQGGVVFLSGEAGIGKTRLARELGAYASLHGMRVLYGRCPALFRMDGVPPYVLWRQVVKDYLETCTPEQLYRVVGFCAAEVVKLVPELRQKLPTIPQSFPISPEQEQNRLFEAVSQFITNISREIPLLVVLDDLQWTDPSSILLLHYLVRGVYRTSLLILGAYRSTDIDSKHPLTPVLTELNRERLLQSILLKRMSLNDISEMIRRLLEQDDASSEFCKMVYEKTRGNPFFAEEVVGSLKEEGVIHREGNVWKIREVSKIEFPESVKSVIKARIGRLDDECQDLLTMASFVGNDFTFEALSSVASVEEDKLLALLEKMLKTRLIKEKLIRGEGMYSFADTIVRDVVHDEVSLMRHKKLHCVVGCALEKVYAGKTDEHLGELAYHFLEGGDRGKALDFFLKAGEKAQGVYAHNEAFSYFHHALELLEEGKADPERRASVIERLGDLKAWVGETDACLKHWDESLTLWNQLGEKRRVADLHVKMAKVLWDEVGDKAKASEHHSAALQILEKGPESVELGRLYEDISHMLVRTGELAKALPLVQKALRLAERFGDAETLAECYVELAGMATGFEEAIEYAEKGLKIALENNCIETALRSYNNISYYYDTIGDAQKVVETLQKGFELGKKVGETHCTSWIGRTLAYSYWGMGEVQKALALAEELLTLSKRTKDTVGIAQATYEIGVIYVYLGEWDQGLQYLKENYRIATDTSEYATIAYAAVSLGELFMEMGEYSEAEKYLNEGNNACEKAGDAFLQVSLAFPPLTKLYLKRGEIEKANDLIERIHQYALRKEFKIAIGRAEMLKGMLCRAQKNWEESIQHFEKSLAEWKSLGAEKWYVRSYAELLYEHGLAYLERNEEGDKKMALSLLNQALDIYKRTGATKRAEKTRMALVEAEQEVASKLEPRAVVSVYVPGHISTGHAGLDGLLCGGIPEGYTVALTAPSCDERDSLIRSFLESGTKEGEVTFYVTIDPSVAKPITEELSSSFYLLVCNPQVGAIVDSAPNIFKLKGVENLTDISIALTSAIRKPGVSQKRPKRICIDLISDVLLQHHAVQTRRWLRALIAELKSKEFTTLGVMDPQMHPPEEHHAILGLFDGEISIYEKESQKGPAKFLKIKKMSNQKYLDDELLLKK